MKKKLIALMMTLAMLLTALVIPALADDAQAPEIPQSSSSDSSFGNGQPPQMPGNSNSNSSFGNGQPPQMPGNSNSDSSSGNGQAPNMHGGFPGQPGGNEKKTDFEQLLADGVISQETYDAIMAYMQSHMPSGQPGQQNADGTAPAQGSEPPALPDGQNADGTAPAQGSEPPALPDGQNADGTAPAQGSEPPALPDGQNSSEASADPLLNDLLTDGIITEDIYNAILAATAANNTAA